MDHVGASEGETCAGHEPPTEHVEESGVGVLGAEEVGVVGGERRVFVEQVGDVAEHLPVAVAVTRGEIVETRKSVTKFEATRLLSMVTPPRSGRLPL